MRARTRRQPSDRDQQPLTAQTPQSPWPAAGRLVQPATHRHPICQPDHGIRARAEFRDRQHGRRAPAARRPARGGVGRLPGSPAVRLRRGRRVRTPAEDRRKTNEFPELAPAIAHLDLICAVMTWMTSTRRPGHDYATGTTIGYASCCAESIGDNASKPRVRRRYPTPGGVEPLKQTLRHMQLQNARTPAAVVGSVVIWRSR
jgi:hypothetical protein